MHDWVICCGNENIHQVFCNSHICMVYLSYWVCNTMESRLWNLSEVACQSWDPVQEFTCKRWKTKGCLEISFINLRKKIEQWKRRIKKLLCQLVKAQLTWADSSVEARLTVGCSSVLFPPPCHLMLAVRAVNPEAEMFKPWPIERLAVINKSTLEQRIEENTIFISLGMQLMVKLGISHNTGSLHLRRFRKN